MCGIVGIIDRAYDSEDARQLISAMCQEIRHRGPDDQGTWVGDGIALGARRLAIIDRAGGRQPVFNEDHTIFVVFNGEIYNYADLGDRLRRLGHRFRTDCDTEVIVHAYEQYGDDCVKHLRGMFTFALWDRKRQRLLAACDRFGKKPLNYYWDGQRLILGSEIKSLLQAGIPREVNALALDEYLIYGYIPSPNTLFQGVLKLPPAHILVYEDGRITTKLYWELPFTPTCQDDEATAIERTRTLLKEAVKVRLMSDVPLGAFLSGGIDSRVVVALMSELTARPVQTFSIGFEQDNYSEFPYARRIAHQFGTDHHEFVIRPELVSALPELVWAYDEPFADPSVLPTYYLSKLAREYVTVALSGDGGDEIFGGYNQYRRQLRIERLPAGLRYLFGHASTLMPEGLRGRKHLTTLHCDLATRYTQSSTLYPVGWRSAMYLPEYFVHVRNHDPCARQMTLFQMTLHLDTVARMQHADARLLLPDNMLVKVDKASMLNSLETRAPLLDQELVEYVTSLPSALRVRNGTLKYVLKQATADLLPRDIVARKKHGFSVPLDLWFCGELADVARDVLDSTRARQRGIFQPDFIRKLLQEQASTRLVRYGRIIWALLCLETWFQVFLDAPTSAGAHHELEVVSKRAQLS
jgi:asparagine synthase (glutamine-hydrolysing)